MSKAPSKKKGPPSQTPFTDFIKKLYHEDSDVCEDLWELVVAAFQEYYPGLTERHVQIFLQGAVCGCACCIDEEIAYEANPSPRKGERSRRHVHEAAPSSKYAGSRPWPMSQFPNFNG